jgi:hypothetical protein
LSTLKEAAGVPPKLTEDALEKLAPEIVTVTPVPALIGVNEAMVGDGINVNPASVATPPGVVTETLPDAPPATTAVIVVAFTTLNEEADVPPKLTAVAPVKLVPVMVTVVPDPALVGAKEVMLGAGITVKFVPETTVIPFTVTLIGPVAAPEGTVVLILLPPPIIEIGDAVTLLKKLTVVTYGAVELKLLPSI